MATQPRRNEQTLEATDRPELNTYYRYPTLKPVDWGWQVILYFFLGGLAAGSYVIATLVDLFGNVEDRPVAQVGRYISLVSIAISPLLLIADLGRRERFTNMLRIMKTRSPISMGTWGLSGFGFFVGLGALRQAVEDNLIGKDSAAAQVLAWFPLPIFGVLGSLFSFFVASYTGVLLSFTNVPIWAKNHLLQGPLFLTSALSSALAAISLVLATRRRVAPRTERWLHWTEDAVNIGELGLVAGTVATLGPMARPLFRRPYALPFWLGAVGLGLIAPLVLRHSGNKSSRDSRSGRSIAAHSATLLGALVLRGVIVLAGRESVKNPQDYLSYTESRRRVDR